MLRLVRAARLIPLVVLFAVTTSLAIARWMRPTQPVYEPQRGYAPASASVTESSADAVRATLAAGLAQSPSADARPSGTGLSGGGPYQMHGDAQRTHRAGVAGPQTADVGWQVDVGGAVAAQITVARDGKTLYVATLASELVALDAGSGRVRWRANLGGRVYAAPTVMGNGTIVVGSDAKTLFAFGPDGKSQWTFALDGEADNAPLLTTEGSLVVAAGRQLLGLSAAGNLLYRLKLRHKIYTAPAQLTSGTVVFGAQDNCIYGVDPAGAIVFKTATTADVDGSPVAAEDGAFFIGNDAGEVLKLDSSGKVLWKSAVGGFVRGALSLSRNGDVIVGHYGPGPRVVRLRARDGEVVGALAVQGTGAKEFGVHGGPLEDVDGALYFGAQDDYVTALNSDGSLRFRWNAGGDVDAPLTLIAPGQLVFGSDTGKVTMLGHQP
jgi:outer membrane protein assembly factor BamB